MAWLLARLAPRRHPQRAWLPRLVILVILVGAFLAIVVFKNSGPFVQRDEVVTILANEAGWRSRSQGRYVPSYSVSGRYRGQAYAQCAIYTPGDSVRVVYSRNLRWGYVTVLMHNRTSASPNGYQAQQGR